MRIVGGDFGGRRLVVPRGVRVRPTADRVREAWMSILGPAVHGAAVLDLCAGSGALGLEALSRGATSVTFVDNAQSLMALQKNIEILGVSARCRVHRGDALRFAQGLGAGAFDIAFADPPYALDLAERLVATFRQTPFARILSVEHAAGQLLAGDDTRRYGDTGITFCFAP